MFFDDGANDVGAGTWLDAVVVHADRSLRDVVFWYSDRAVYDRNAYGFLELDFQLQTENLLCRIR